MGDWGSGWQRRPQHQRRQHQHQHQRRGVGSYLNGASDGPGEPPSTTFSSRRPPPSGGWRPQAPSWEKDFCYGVGIPWKKVLEAKELMSFYKNIVQWDDSAGEEAFHNAKMRFWAWRNHLPCDIPLPDPDMYNDHIDWNWKIDPELVLDLEKKVHPLVNDEGGNLNHERSGWDADLPNEPVKATGWVDAGDSSRNIPPPTGWEESDRKEENLNNGWGWTPGWGDANVDDCGVNNGKSWRIIGNDDCRENQQVWRGTWNGNYDHYYSDSKKNGKKREGVGYGSHNSRNARSRQNGRDVSNTWRNFGGAG